MKQEDSELRKCGIPDCYARTAKLLCWDHFRDLPNEIKKIQSSKKLIRAAFLFFRKEKIQGFRIHKCGSCPNTKKGPIEKLPPRWIKRKDGTILCGVCRDKSLRKKNGIANGEAENSAGFPKPKKPFRGMGYDKVSAGILPVFKRPK